MRLIEKKKGINPDTFAPVLIVTVELAIEQIMDGTVLLGEEEMTMKIGREFLKALGVINERKD